MPASAVNTIKNIQKRINFKSKKNENFVLIQSDEILVIFQVASKIAPIARS